MSRCCIYGCQSKSRGAGVVLFHIPSQAHHSNNKGLTLKRRSLWLKAIRQNRTIADEELDDARVCSRHFISGAPAMVTEQFDPDWVPSQNLGPEINLNSEYITNIPEHYEDTDNIKTELENGYPEILETCDPPINTEELLDIKEEVLTMDEPETFMENSACNDRQEDKVQKVRNFVKQIKDLQSVCRGCLGDEDVANMNEATIDGVTTVVMYETVTKTKINTTNVPAQMCVKCIPMLFQTYKFLKTLQNSFEVLDKIAMELKNKSVNYSVNDTSKNIMAKGNPQNYFIIGPVIVLSKLGQGNFLTRNIIPAKDQGGLKLLGPNVNQTVTTPSQNQSVNSLNVPSSSTQETLPTTSPDVSKTTLSKTKTKCPICKKLVHFYIAHLKIRHYLNLDQKKCLYCGYNTKDIEALFKHSKNGHAIQNVAKHEINKGKRTNQDESNKQLDVLQSCSENSQTVGHCNQDGSTEKSMDVSSQISNKSKKKLPNIGITDVCQICDKLVPIRPNHLRIEHSVNWLRKKCLKCSFIANSTDMLVEHVKMENGLMEIRCKECELEFLSVDQYTRHMKFSLCRNKNLLVTQIKWPPRLKKKWKYTCNKCQDLGFDEYLEIDKHFRECHREDPNCILCDEKLRYHWFAISHMAIRHGRRPCCKICCIIFKTQEELRLHYKSPEHNSICSICNEKFRRRTTLYNHMRSKHFLSSSVKRIIKCPECPKEFTYVNSVRRHVQTAHRDMRFLCDTCGKVYTSNLALQRHVRKAHKGEVIVSSQTKKNKFICEECGQKFAFYDKWSIAVHKAKHKGHASVCKKCCESFETEDELKGHVKEKNHELFKCEQCFTEFCRKINYLHHMQERLCRLKKPLPNPKYTCEYCGKMWSAKSRLTIHRRTHTKEKPYKCKFCKKSFATQVHLSTHLNIHLGIKKWVCKFCKKKFTHQTTLISHEMIHTGERPYKCSDCGKGFTSSSAMKKHRKTHFKTKTVKVGSKTLRNRVVEEMEIEESNQSNEALEAVFEDNATGEVIEHQEENEDIDLNENS